MLEMLATLVLALVITVWGYLLYRRHNQEPINPTIARESRPRKPGTGQFWDESGAGGI